MEIALAERAPLMFDFQRVNSKPTVGAPSAGGAGTQRVPRKDMGQRRCCQANPLPAFHLSEQQAGVSWLSETINPKGFPFMKKFIMCMSSVCVELRVGWPEHHRPTGTSNPVLLQGHFGTKPLSGGGREPGHPFTSSSLTLVLSQNVMFLVSTSFFFCSAAASSSPLPLPLPLLLFSLI